mgnify:CR=1 FL=1
MNSCLIHGRLVRDPEMKGYTTSRGDDGSLTKFTVAVDRRFGEETDFFDCVCYGKLAEVIHKHFSKGREIVVSGEMQCHKYEAKDGTNRYPWSLIVSTFDFCGKKDDAKGGTGGSTEAAADEFGPVDDDDIPF